MWQLQIVHGEEYAALADGNRLRRLATTAPRGKIYDRDRPGGGRQPAGVHRVRRARRPHGGTGLVVERLGAILGMAPEEIEEALEGGQPGVPVRAHPGVPGRAAGSARWPSEEERRMDLPGVMLEQEPVRRYTAGQAMSHVLGYLLSASPEDWRMYAGYRPDDLVGEAASSGHTRSTCGAAGFQQVEVNALSRAIRASWARCRPVPGHDLVLTVDAALQQAVMDIITRRLEELAAIRTGTRPPGGAAVVVLDVRTGAVLALVSVPTYDNDRLLSEELTEYCAAAAGGPPVAHVQPGAARQLPAGLVLQARTLLAALGRGVTRRRRCTTATGTVEVGGTVFRDWTVTRGCRPPGRWTRWRPWNARSTTISTPSGMRRAFRPSPTPPGRWAWAASSGLDIRPAESPAWCRNRPGNAARCWKSGIPGDTVNVSIGQGYLQVTPLQMALMYMGIADRGVVYQPYLIQADHRAHGRNRARTGAGGVEPPGGAPSSWDVLHAACGRWWPDPGARPATRSATFPLSSRARPARPRSPGGGETHTWFAACTPADEPEVAVRSADGVRGRGRGHGRARGVPGAGGVLRLPGTARIRVP